jgi:Glycosyltransferase family 87
VVPIVAVAIVMGSVFFSGVLKQMGAKDIDARYFYVAAKCWAAGESPYDPATYQTMYRLQFGAQPDAGFVAYLPTLMVVILPMAPFDWPVAAKIFSLLNFSAAMVLFWACYRLVRESLGSPLRPKHWLWVTIASTIGGISGAILTGQTSVFIAAACALAVVGCRLQRPWMTVVGLVVASAKPHLSGPILLFIAASERPQRRAMLIAIAGAALICCYAALIDPNIVRSYLGSIAAYNSLASNDPTTQIGLVSLLVRGGTSLRVAQLAGASCLAVVMGLAAWLLWKSRQGLSSSTHVMMLLIFSAGLARPIQAYDVCVYALGIGLLGTVESALSFGFLVPAILLWRPGLLDQLHLAIPNILVATGAWLAMLIGSMFLIGNDLRRSLLRVHGSKVPG